MSIDTIAMIDNKLTESEIHIIETELYLLFVRWEINQDELYKRINDILEWNS